MKICFISYYVYRLFNSRSRIVFGGIETLFYLVARDLAADKRFAVTFLLEDDVHKSLAAEKNNGITLFKTSRQLNPWIYQDKRIKRYHLWFKYCAGILSRLASLPHLDFFRLWDNLKQIGADVYVYGSPNYESGLITLLTKIIRKKSIYLVASDEVLDQEKQKKNKIHFWGMKHADAIWSLSPRQQKILKNRFHFPAVNIPCWFPRPKKLFPLRERKFLLWVGRIEARKRPESFLKLARSLPGLKFVMIIAPSPNEHRLFNKVTKEAVKVRNLKLKQNVAFTTLTRYYRKASVFIDTSDYKNMNMTQVQAAYFKTPCLSLFHDPNNTFRDYHWGLSAGGDFKQMLQNIKKVLNLEDIWENLSQSAGAFANTVYNREENLAVFKRLILELV